VKSMLASFFKILSERRAKCYSSGFFSSIEIPCKVLSVGNLSVGGTGKTPVADWILKEALRRGIKTVLIARNYKAKLSGAHRVEVGLEKAAEKFGDEPTLLAIKNPEVSVFVGEKKWQSAQVGYDQIKPQLMVIDDGFQHLRLKRDFNVLLLDVSRPKEEYQVLPLGRLRESLEAAQRADLIIYTKIQNRNEETLKLLQAQLPKDRPTASLGYRLEVSSQFGAEEKEIHPSFFLCSGLANPESFFEAVRERWKRKEIKSFPYPDHFNFSGSDVALLESEAERSQARILVTEKDWVKLKDVTSQPKLYQVIEVQVYWEKPPVSLYEFLDQIV
jgi:tetraacyldisaccharide 4'-kinase